VARGTTLAGVGGALTVSGNSARSATGNDIRHVSPTANALVNVTGGRATLAGTRTDMPEDASRNSGSAWTVLATTRA
jgi:hypothetical protein